MGKIRVGNKENAILNREWGGHVKSWCKKYTAKTRRNLNQRIIREAMFD